MATIHHCFTVTANDGLTMMLLQIVMVFQLMWLWRNWRSCTVVERGRRRTQHSWLDYDCPM